MIGDIELNRIEADVVVVLENPDIGAWQTLPLWECQMTPKELRTYVVRASLAFAEQCGGGFVNATVYDWRPDTAEG